MTRLQAVIHGTPGRWLSLLLVLALVAGGLWIAWPREGPQHATGPAPARPSMPLLVSAGLAGRGSPATVRPGVTLTVTGHVLGSAAITALELWDGTRRAAVTRQQGTSPAFHATWTWRAGDVGEHVLVVRAVDAQGRVAQSGALWVTVSGDPVAAAPGDGTVASPAPSAYALEEPRATVAVTGCNAQVTVDAAASARVTGFGVLGLAPQGAGFITLGTLWAHPADGAARFNVPLPPGETELTLTAFDAATETLGAPLLVRAPASCGSAEGWTGTLRLQDGRLLPAPDADRVYLYLSQDGGAARRVPAEPGSTVSAVNGAFDFRADLPATTGRTLHLEAWGWQAGQLVDLGSGDWSSPAQPTTAPGARPQVSAAGSAAAGWFDASPSSLAITTTLAVLKDVITNGGGCGTELCRGQEPVPNDQLERPEPGSSQPDERTFRWSTLAAGASSLVWQVLPYPTAATPDLAPPFLIDTGTLPLDAGATTGEFTIDFRPYLVPGPMSAAIGDTATITGQLASSLFPGSSPSVTAGSPSPTGAPGGSAAPGAIGAIGAIGSLRGSTTSGSAAARLSLGRFLLGSAGRFYIRVIPIVDGVPGSPSAPVTLDVVDPPSLPDLGTAQPADPGSYTIQFSTTLPKSPDPHYARCAIVTKVNQDQYPALSPVDYPAYLKSGKPLCYQPPDDGWSILDAFDAFVDFVADVWDAISSAYDSIKQAVVKVVLAAVPCKAIASDEVCTRIANTALDAALASFGIPPSLPNFDAVVAASRGDLASFVVNAASGLPGVSDACGLADAANQVTSKVETCTELAGDAIDAAVDRVISARSAAASQASGYAWPGVVLAPDPRGQYQPPSVKFTVTRTSDPYVPDECTLSVSLDSVVKDWTFTELQYDQQTRSSWPTDVTRDVSGSPFLPATATIPKLAPGESYTGQVWLTRTSGWYESMDAYMYWHYYESLATVDRSWVLLNQGARVTYHVTSNCTPSVQETDVLPSAGYNG